MADADYSQIEYRVLTALAGNDFLAELFANPDSDYHTLMASLMYDVPYASVTSAMRSAAKSFNFGIPYGMGLGSLAILLTGTNTPQTRAEAAEKYEMYFKNQPKTRKFFEQVKEMAQVNKYTETLWHRRRYYSFTNEDGTVNEARKAAALRQAGNAVIQGTAADVFKIGVARNFSFIKNNNLLGKVLIVNMVHDEQLMEWDVQSVNPQRILAEVGKNMQFALDGFPPLYIGAGIGKAWGYAKGKMAEIHPNLLKQLTEEAENIPILRTPEQIAAEPVVDVSKVLKYFDDRVYNFRKQKVYDYIVDKQNWHQDMHPAIGGLINLQFNYGRGDDAKGYKTPEGKSVTDTEFLMLNLEDFIKETNAPVTTDLFTTQELIKEPEPVEDDYDDNEEDLDGLDDLYDEYAAGDTEAVMSLTDNTVFGSSIVDLVDNFKVFVSKKRGICALDLRFMSLKANENLAVYLEKHEINPDNPPEGKPVFRFMVLQAGRQLIDTGHYLADIKASEIERIYKEEVVLQY